MFALDDRQSLVDLISIWFKEADCKSEVYERPTLCYLIGLKVDKTKERIITRDEAEVRC